MEPTVSKEKYEKMWHQLRDRLDSKLFHQFAGKNSTLLWALDQMTILEKTPNDE